MSQPHNPGAPASAQAPRKAEGRVIAFPGESSLTPDPGPASAGRPHIVQRTTVVANRRFTEILPRTKERLLASIDSRLRKVAFEFSIDCESMDQMLREQLERRRVSRMARVRVDDRRAA